MQKQSSRIWYKGKDHKDIYFQGKYHCAAYLRGELVWEKYLDGKWVYTTQKGVDIFCMETLDPITKEVKTQAGYSALNMNYNSDRYIVYHGYSIAHHNEKILISNIGGNRLNNFTDIITRSFNFVVPLDERILICENKILYELNEVDDIYELLEVGELPSGFEEYTFGRQGKFLIASNKYNEVSESKIKWYSFDSDNVFKDFVTANRPIVSAVCQDKEKVYVLQHEQSNVYPYLDYATVYIYDGNSTQVFHPDLGGKWTRDIAMIKRGKKFYIYEKWLHGNGYKYLHIYVTEDFSHIDFYETFKCTVSFENGFYVNNKYYDKVAFVADVRREQVDDDAYKIEFPINNIARQIPVYYESGEIDHDRDDLVLPFIIREFDSTAYLVAYFDNLTFQESDGNFGR